VDIDMATARFFPELNPDWEQRFLKLPAVEQRRLINLLKYMNSGHQLDQNVLAGFPRESLGLLRDMFSKGEVVEEAPGTVDG
jgi:hypothetical protein